MPIYKDFRYTEKEDYIIIRAYCGDEEDVVVPESIKKKPVEEISHSAFVPECDALQIANNDYGKRCSKRVKSVRLPDTVKRMDGAFNCCFELESATIPKGVESIGDWCFRRCEALREIHVVEDNAYYSSQEGVLYSKDGKRLLCCPQKHPLESLSADDYLAGVEEIGTRAFEFCENLQTVSIPETLTRVNSCAFYGCKNLTQLQLHENIHLLDGGHFALCHRLDNVIYYNAEGLIPGSEFDGCRLKNLEIRCKVKSIGEGAFCATKFSEFVVPAGTRTINARAFMSCIELKKVVLPRSVQRIHKYAFARSGKTLEEAMADPLFMREMKSAATFYVVPGSKAEAICKELGYTIEYI